MPGGTPSDELFINPAATFDHIAALRGRVASTPEAVANATTGRAGSDEALAALATLTATVPSATAVQLELLARLATLGALDAVIADGPSSPQSS
ncbi:MAG: hypothetical protein ACK5OX_06025 [Desertimonas sp.]